MSKAVKRPSRAELEAQLSLCRTNCRHNWIAKAIQWGGTVGVCLVLCFYGNKSIQALAGKQTTANIQINAQASASASASAKMETEHRVDAKLRSKLEVDGNQEVFGTALLPIGWLNYLSILFGVGGLLYGRAQSKLRKDIVEKYHPEVVRKESYFDSNRTSSDLTARGETRPEDL